jgi:tRNA pseudouridine38-40 synthase
VNAEKVTNNLAKIAMVVEYEGTSYCGFQYQINASSVQGEIEKALLKLTGEQIRVVAASRTDTGVHAKGQVVCFRSGSGFTLDTFVKGVNYYLPQDISARVAYKVDESFNVQRDAISREYCYYLFCSATRSPLKRGFTLQIKADLDIELMNKASQLLVGEHDLASFVTEISRSVIKSTLRKVYKAQVERRGNLVVFDIVAKSFLPHQVRNTVGTLIRVGQGKIGLDDFKTIMEARKPGLAGPKVPAQGLYLIQVNYPRPLGEYDENL